MTCWGKSLQRIHLGKTEKKYLRHFLAQYYPDAINLPFGGLNIVLCGDFSQLNPIGRDVIYDRNINALWNCINEPLDACEIFFGIH